MEDETTPKNDEDQNEEEQPEEELHEGIDPNEEAQEDSPEPGGAPEAIPEALPISGEVFSPPPAEDTATKKPDFFRKALPWVIAVLVSLLAGFLVGFFLLYQPANIQLRNTTSEWLATQEQLSLVESELDISQNSLKQTQGDLESTQAMLVNASFNQALADVQANIAYARLALVTKDLLTARQELSAADGNLRTLNAMLEDPETADALDERLKSIRARLVTDPALALEEIRLLSENLSRIERR
jgi:hypothetical protein